MAVHDMHKFMTRYHSGFAQLSAFHYNLNIFLKLFLYSLMISRMVVTREVGIFWTLKFTYSRRGHGDRERRG